MSLDGPRGRCSVRPSTLFEKPPASPGNRAAPTRAAPNNERARKETVNKTRAATGAFSNAPESLCVPTNSRRQAVTLVPEAENSSQTKQVGRTQRPRIFSAIPALQPPRMKQCRERESPPRETPRARCGTVRARPSNEQVGSTSESGRRLPSAW